MDHSGSTSVVGILEQLSEDASAGWIVPADLGVARFSGNLGIFPCLRACVFLIEIHTTYHQHVFDLFLKLLDPVCENDGN